MSWVRGFGATARAMLPIAVPLLVSTAVFDRQGEIAIRAAAIIAACAAVAAVAQTGMARARPASLEIRRRPALGARGQPLIDAAGLVVFLTYLIGWLAFLPLDAARLHLVATPPSWIRIVGFVTALLGCALGQRALWDNAFASPAVQTHVNQVVIDTGAYRLVRHPLYAGNLFFFAGMALWIGSLAGLLGVGIILLFTLARTVIEERRLRNDLSGYAAYAGKVRARLIPYLL